MIRAPILNTVLNAASTARQLLRKPNAFEEAISRQAATTEPLRPLCIRDLSSGGLWLLACVRARNLLLRAYDGQDPAAIEKHIGRLSELLRLGQALAELGVVGSTFSRPRFLQVAERWHLAAVQRGLDEGHIVPGKTRGVPATVMLRVRVEASVSELVQREEKQRQQLDMAMQGGFAGTGFLNLEDSDLTGLSDNMKSIWASSLGSAAFWQKSTYKVPIGRDAMNRISSFCQNPVTRSRMFEAYFTGFGPEVDIAALDLLRTRRALAKGMGFTNWASYELAAMALKEPAAAHQLMDRCWHDAQPALQQVLQRMAALTPASAASSSKPKRRLHGQRLLDIPHADEAFLRAHATHEADTWKLAEFLPASQCIPRILELVGKSYGVHFHEMDKPSTSTRIFNGWHTSVRIFEVFDGAAMPSISGRDMDNKSLGFVYLDLYARQGLFSRAACRLAGAFLMCDRHAYINMGMPAASYGQAKLLNPEEVVAMAHELGHAIHMLCHQGSLQEFDDLPLDVKELPSTLAETIALQPGAMVSYARHFSSGGPPPDSLIRSCQRDINFFVRYLQNTSVALGLHGDDFDPDSASPQELRAAAVSLWQRYSPVLAHPAFTPFGEDAGLYMAQGPNQIAYLLCYLRVDSILHTSRRASQPGTVRATPTRARDAAWSSADFASRVRKQLLDRTFSGQRLAALLPILGSASTEMEIGHPLPPPPMDAAQMFGRLSRAG